MQLKQLEYLVQVISCRSLSQAAKNLYLSQPALSMAIQSLERELGFPLLQRTNHGVEPTYMGERVYQDAKRLLSEVDTMEQNWAELHRARSALAGIVRMVSCAPINPFLEKSVLPNLKKAYPNLIFQTLESNQAYFADFFHPCHVDFAIGDDFSPDLSSSASWAKAHGLTVVPLCPDQWKVAISAKNPLSAQTELVPADLTHIPFASFSAKDDVIEENFSIFFSQNPILKYQSLEKIVRATVVNDAISVLPQRMTLDGSLLDYGKDAIVFREIDGFSLSGWHVLFYSPDENLEKRTAVAAELRNAFALSCPDASALR
jgi:DNA-binding transcriptional LysR family regulator